MQILERMKAHILLHLELFTRTNFSQSLSFLICTMGMTIVRTESTGLTQTSAKLKYYHQCSLGKTATCLPTGAKSPVPGSAGGPPHQQEACWRLDNLSCHSPFLSNLLLAPPPTIQVPLTLEFNVESLRLVAFWNMPSCSIAMPIVYPLPPWRVPKLQKPPRAKVSP